MQTVVEVISRQLDTCGYLIKIGGVYGTKNTYLKLIK